MHRNARYKWHVKFTQLSLICLPRKAYSRIDFELKKANVHANSSTKIINLCKAVIVQHIFLKSKDISLHLQNLKVVLVFILHFMLRFGIILHNILETQGCIFDLLYS